MGCIDRGKWYRRGEDGENGTEGGKMGKEGMYCNCVIRRKVGS